MPHDKKGQLLKVGDHVTLSGVITKITNEEETYCNATFTPDIGMKPEEDGTENTGSYAISCRQVELSEPKVNRDALRAVLYELKLLRNQVQILQAKCEVIEVFKLALANPNSNVTVGYSPDPVPELEEFIRSR